MDDVHCRNVPSLVIRTLQAEFALTRREASNEASRITSFSKRRGTSQRWRR
jgi:hypothetical protein